MPHAQHQGSTGATVDPIDHLHVLRLLNRARTAPFKSLCVCCEERTEIAHSWDEPRIPELGFWSFFATPRPNPYNPDCHHRDRVPAARWYRFPRNVVGCIAARRRPGHRDSSGSVGRRRVLRPRAGGAGPVGVAVGCDSSTTSAASTRSSSGSTSVRRPRSTPSTACC